METEEVGLNFFQSLKTNEKDNIRTLDTGEIPVVPDTREINDNETTVDKLEFEPPRVNSNTQQLKQTFWN